MSENNGQIDLAKLTNDLVELRKQIDEKEAVHKAEITPMKEKKDELQTLLVQTMNNMGMASMKNDLGSFMVKKKVGYTFRNEIEAMRWAAENRVVSIDRRLAAQKLKDLDTLPEFVDKTETEYLQFLAAKPKEE